MGVMRVQNQAVGCYRPCRARAILTGAACICLLFLAVFMCSSPLLRESDVTTFNESHAQKTYVATQDIFSNFSDPEETEREPIFPAGTRLKIWVESDDNWIKVRAHQADISRENAPGHTILYIIRDILEEDGAPPEIVDRYPADELEKKLSEILKEVQS